jgi:predicted AlkP superfamily phosphohydrolase/phosphomutase
MSSSVKQPVIVIGLDAAEVGLVTRWMEEGKLPTLASLKKRGCWGRLATVADCFAGAVWPSFFYGVHPGKHDVSSGFPLKPGTLDIVPLLADRNPYKPFSAYTPDSELRVVALDVPKSYPDQQMKGAALVAWGAHAPTYGPSSAPSELLKQVFKEIGRYPLPLGAQENDIDTHGFYQNLRDKLLQGVEARIRLNRYFLQRESWDLFITVLSETHPVGHRFWHFMDPTHPWYDPDAPDELRSAMSDVYSAIDYSVAEILELVPRDAVVLIVSVHGMMPNYNAQELLPRFLEHWSGIQDFQDADGVQISRSSRLLADGMRFLRAVVPPRVRAQMKQIVPDTVRINTRAQYMKAICGWQNWPRMRAFCLPTEDNGYIRVNLKGREPAGLVEPGREYEELLTELTEEILALRDIQTGNPIVERVLRPQEIYPGPFKSQMPDLVTYWSSASPVSGLHSPRFGDIVTKLQVQHRSGIHRAEGFLIATGPSLPQGETVIGAHILDLAPTILSLLGYTPPSHLDGRVLTEVVSGTVGPKFANSNYTA